MPEPKKKRTGKVMLPVRGRTLVEDFERRTEDVDDLEAVGGVA